MSKSILVIDTPSNCKSCMFCGFGGVNLEKYVCCLTREHSESSHLVGCPLRPLPQKKDIYGKLTFDKMAEYIGYNACLEEIVGDINEGLRKCTGETE